MEIFEQDGGPILFYLHPNLSASRRLRLQRDIEDHGGSLCDEEEDADTIIVNREILDHYKRQFVAERIWVEGPDFVRVCINRNAYYHALPPRKRMGGRTPGAPRNEFTPEDDEHLAQYLATRLPYAEMGGRQGFNVYKELCYAVERYPWVERHPWQSWRGHYQHNVAHFDKRIDEIVRMAPPNEQDKRLYNFDRRVGRGARMVPQNAEEEEESPEEEEFEGFSEDYQVESEAEPVPDENSGGEDDQLLVDDEHADDEGAGGGGVDEPEVAEPTVTKARSKRTKRTRRPAVRARPAKRPRTQVAEPTEDGDDEAHVQPLDTQRTLVPTQRNVSLSPPARPTNDDEEVADSEFGAPADYFSPPPDLPESSTQQASNAKNGPQRRLRRRSPSTTNSIHEVAGPTRRITRSVSRSVEGHGAQAGQSSRRVIQVDPKDVPPPTGRSKRTPAQAPARPSTSTRNTRSISRSVALSIEPEPQGPPARKGRNLPVVKEEVEDEAAFVGDDEGVPSSNASSRPRGAKRPASFADSEGHEEEVVENVLGFKKPASSRNPSKRNQVNDRQRHIVTSDDDSEEDWLPGGLKKMLSKIKQSNTAVPKRKTPMRERVNRRSRSRRASVSVSGEFTTPEVEFPTPQTRAHQHAQLIAANVNNRPYVPPSGTRAAETRRLRKTA